MNSPVDNPHPPAAVDLTNCDREPIHIPGAIQPHGVLLVIRRSDFSISQCSQSVRAILGRPVTDLLNQPLSIVLQEQEISQLRQVDSDEILSNRPVYFSTFKTRLAPELSFNAIAHRMAAHLMLELEPAAASPEPAAPPDLYRTVQVSVNKLRQARGVKQICDVVARQIRDLSGFDRVMVYRFDEDWNGQVISESRRDDLEPFLGLHYPASDIPSQARELYRRNTLRFIADRDYIPSLISPVLDPDTQQPLDMSHSVLRSVSPIHLEYLRNMGVGASMSVSLLRDEKLWGLVACHHYSPRQVPYEVRTACELMAQLMSAQLVAAETSELTEYVDRLTTARQALLLNLEKYEDADRALVEGDPNLLTFVQADGAAVVTGDAVARVGLTPNSDQIVQLTRWLEKTMTGDIFFTDQLRSLFPGGILSGTASGVLGVRLARSRSNMLLWFRTEQPRTVDWAGDPAKSVVKGEGGVRLSPRGSFALWQQTVRGRSLPWTAEEIAAARTLRNDVLDLLLRRAEEITAAHTDLRLASQEREKLLDSERQARAEAERVSRTKDEFVATLSHELRTPLNAILGWSQLMMRDPEATPGMLEGIDVIERNAKAQSRMIEDLLEMSRITSGKLRLDLQDIDFPAIVNSAIDTVSITASAKGVRIEKMIDPLLQVRMTGDPGRLQQVVWNLLTNSVKFTPRGGRIQVLLRRIDSHVELSISDTGIGIAPEFLPHVFDRFRQADSSAARLHGGLGLGLSIVRHLVELHGGTVRASSAGANKGASFVVALPLMILQAGDVDGPTTAREADAQAETLQLAGLHVLEVDDEPDAREFIHRVLLDHSCQVTVAGSMQEALALISHTRFDALITDIGMPVHDGYSLIRAIRHQEAERGSEKLPAIALTAYARPEDRRKALLSGFQAHIAKPVEIGELIAVLASVTGRV